MRTTGLARFVDHDGDTEAWFAYGGVGAGAIEGEENHGNKGCSKKISSVGRWMEEVDVV